MLREASKNKIVSRRGTKNTSANRLMGGYADCNSVGKSAFLFKFDVVGSSPTNPLSLIRQIKECCCNDSFCKKLICGDKLTT